MIKLTQLKSAFPFLFIDIFFFPATKQRCFLEKSRASRRMAVVKSEIEEKSHRRRWVWVVGALLVVLAMAMKPMISHFGGSNKPCHCGKVFSFAVCLVSEKIEQKKRKVKVRWLVSRMSRGFLFHFLATNYMV